MNVWLEEARVNPKQYLYIVKVAGKTYKSFKSNKPLTINEQQYVVDCFEDYLTRTKRL